MSKRVHPPASSIARGCSCAVNSYALVAALTPVLFDWLPDTRLPAARTQ